MEDGEQESWENYLPSVMLCIPLLIFVFPDSWCGLPSPQ